MRRLTSGAVHHYRTVLGIAALLCVLAAALGGTALDKLSGGGYFPTDSPAATAQNRLVDTFHGGPPNLVVIATADHPINTEPDLQNRITTDPRVDWVNSYWTTGDPTLLSDDQRSALFLIRLTGDENTMLQSVRALVPQWRDAAPDLDLAVTGEAQIYQEVNDQSASDLVDAELLGAPVVLILLLLIFRTPLAALLPVVVGAAAVALTTAVLAVLVQLTDVSVFALNVTTALGFGLAVDYSLFVVTRFREELDRGRPLEDAIVTSTAIAGRTVLFSALTVAVSIAALLLFPLYFLRSMAYAAIPVILIGATASVTVLPAMLRLTGRHINRYDLLSRIAGPPRSTSHGWHGLANTVMRRPLLTGIPVVIILLLLAAPFLTVTFGLTDERTMPTTAPARQASALMTQKFPEASRPTLEVLAHHDDPSAALSTRDGVLAVAGPTATYRDGVDVAPGQPTRIADDTTWSTVTVTYPLDDPRTQQLVRDLRATGVDVTGTTAMLVDTKSSITQRLPWAIALIAATTLVLLFLFTGSVLIPLKAIVVNTLSLTASFGAAVYIFQDGHLRWLVGDFTVTGSLELSTVLFMFCVAFGLSMDYEVFLLSRIREQFLATGDNTAAVATGLAKTGRLITAAAAVVAAVLIALATSDLTILKMLGVGLAIAVIVDAVLVRGILVPAFMRLLGSANWWAPRSLRGVHERFGLRE